MTNTYSGTLLGAQDSFHSASVNCGNVFHMFHAIFLSYTTKLDIACITTCKGMKHWESCTSFDPSLLATLWAAKYRKCLPVTNASHSSTGSLKVYIKDTASTTTSMSTVLISSFSWPWCAAWQACSNMQVSAYSCIHEEIESRSSSNVLFRTDSPTVMTSCFSFKLNESIRAWYKNWIDQFYCCLYKENLINSQRL